MTTIDSKNNKTKTTKHAPNTLMTTIAIIAIISFGMVLQIPSVSAIQSNPDDPNACNERISDDAQNKSASFDETKAQNIAGNSSQFKEAVGNDPYKFVSVSYTWTSNATTCTVQPKDMLVEYIVTDKNGAERAVTVAINPDYTYKQIFVETNLPHHNSSTAANWGGYSVKGASTEAASLVYRATLNWDIPTPNDPPKINCGTVNEQQCIISVWTGLSQNEGGTSNLAQVGTDSYCENNNCSSGRLYKGWIETFSPGSTLSTCSTNTYSPGDSMFGDVVNEKKTGGSVTKYDFSLTDTSTSTVCSLPSVTYGSTDPHYGQYITERPNFGTLMMPKLARVPDFGTSIGGQYGQIYYGGVTNPIYTPISTAASWFMKWQMNNGVVDNESFTSVNPSNVFTINWANSTAP